MVELTPSLLGNSLIISIIVIMVSFAIQVYMIFLNWKQSKVKNQMSELLEVMREIKDYLKKYGGKINGTFKQKKEI